MRIAILMSLLSPWAREVARSLAALGHDVHAIDFDDSHLASQSYLASVNRQTDPEFLSFKQNVAGVHLLAGFASSNARYLLAGKSLRRILTSCEADVLLTLYAGGFSLLAYVSGFRPYAVYTVGSDVLKVTGSRKIISRIGIRNAGVVFANGDHLARKTKELAPSSTVVPLLIGIDTDRFSPKCSSTSPLKIVCTRGFHEVYNNAYIIEGLGAMTGDTPDFRLTFVSGGHLLPQAKALADSTLKSEIRERVAFLGGVQSDRLLSELQESHIYASVSRSDGTSTSLLEAMACGLFPVVSDIPQNREWIFPEKRNGILVPLDDPESMGRALATALNCLDEFDGFAQFNRQQVLDRADCQTNMATLSQHLDTLIRKR